jgi:hypothetical protein
MTRKWLPTLYPILFVVWFLTNSLILNVSAQTQTGQASALSYSRLYEKPRKLFDQWAVEQNKTKNENLTPAERYNQLSLSQRTTFEAVTHALWFTKLTDQSGKPMEAAIDLIAELENIAGEVPGKRGDVQYRLYTKMVPDAEKKLLECQEFKRDKDNTVFHKEYPLNFRQKGKYPTIQFSMTRGGDRADIDVDYKSSKPPQALFNGHLTAGNSDVRSGNNYNGHVSHWKGLINWWKGLFKPTPATKTQQAAQDIVEADQPELQVFENISDASKEFFNDWLVRRNLKQALAFYSPDADACINADEDSENELLKDKDARTLFVEVLQTANTALGKPRDLSSTISAVEPWDPELKVVDQPNKAFFTLLSVSDKEAEEFLCISESSVEPTKESKPSVYGNYYETIFTFQYPKGDNQGGMILLWKKENNNWRILSYDDLEL